MKQEYRQNIVVVLGEPYVQMRRALRSTLNGEGFRQVTDIGDIAGFKASINDPMPDVIVVDINLPGGDDICDLIRDIRADRLGRNPFVPIIGTTWEADRDRVRKAVDCGIDDLLVKPVAPGMIIDRISILARNRKQFIVTSDYIGPDRRKPDQKREGDDIPRFDVPNTLRVKSEGKSIDMNAWAEAKRQSLDSLNIQRLKAAAFQISFLAEQLIPALRTQPTSAAQRPFLERLSSTAVDISERAAKAGSTSLVPLCEAVGRVARELTAINQGAPDDGRLDKNLRLLKQVSDALLAGFNPDKEAGRLAEQVASAIARFQSRTQPEGGRAGAG